MSVYPPRKVVRLARVGCPACKRPVRAVLRQGNGPVSFPCGCGLNKAWADAFDAEMKARERGDQPRDVTARADALRTARLGDALAEFQTLLVRRALVIFRADYDGQARVERALLTKRAYLLTEGATDGDVAALEGARLHPDVFEAAEAGRLRLPPSARCWSPYPFTLSQTDLYGAVDAIEDFRRYGQAQRHEASRMAFADRNAGISGGGQVVRELNSFTIRLYTHILPETQPVLTVRASETAYMDQHPGEAMTRRLANRAGRRVTAAARPAARRPPPAYDRTAGSPDDEA